MVRGRRTRVNDASSMVVARAMNGSNGNTANASSNLSLDDHFCASPKRKDCRRDESNKKSSIVIPGDCSNSGKTYVNGAGSNGRLNRTNGGNMIGKLSCLRSTATHEVLAMKTRSQTIKNYFKTEKTRREHYSHSSHSTSPSSSSLSPASSSMNNVLPNGYSFANENSNNQDTLQNEVVMINDDYNIPKEIEDISLIPEGNNKGNSGIKIINSHSFSSPTTIDLTTEDTCDEIFDKVKHSASRMDLTEIGHNGNSILTDGEMSGSSASIPISKRTVSSSSSSSSDNIFLQEPVLSLNVDKSPNQPSSIKINKTLEVNPIFAPNNNYHNLNLNGQFHKIVTLNGSNSSTNSSSCNSNSNSSNNFRNNDPSSSKNDITNGRPNAINRNNRNIANRICSPRRDMENNISILYNHDSNSCDSGVVIDNKLELSPSRRRKPTTPHRILCPSPVKYPSIERAPESSTSSQLSTPLSSSSSIELPLGDANNIVHSPVNGTAKSEHLNGLQKNVKSRRRLNINRMENGFSKTPHLIGGVILSEETLIKMNGAGNSNEHVNNPISNNNNNNNIPKPVLNSIINPTAEQNTNNNNKKRANNQHKGNKNQTASLNGNAMQNNGGNRELTEFFPVRRSIRKTKRAVQEEIMKNFEQAILEGREEGLKVEHFEGKGRGVVAGRIFKRGEFVVEYIGDLITMSEANDREKKYALDENAGCYMYYFKHRNQQYCIDATAETGKLGRLVNHSRNGNLITKVVVVKNRPHLVLIAKDDIQPGEELTYDYGDRSKEALLHHPWLAF